MKKIAIFTEGMTELVFVRQFLLQSINAQRLSFRCIELVGRCELDFPYFFDSPTADLFFLLVNVGNDNRVLSEIRERQDNLVMKGYCTIVGLRDMYSAEYRKRSLGIDDDVTSAFIDGHRATVASMSQAEHIRFHFAIMEIEAWLLSMYDLFGKLHHDLTIEFIEQNLGINVRTVDPETEFFHPTAQINNILGLVGMRYEKSADQAESIFGVMDDSDILCATEAERCNSLEMFANDIWNLARTEPPAEVVA